jgi:hypothetical protein
VLIKGEKGLDIGCGDLPAWTTAVPGGLSPPHGVLEMCSFQEQEAGIPGAAKGDLNSRQRRIASMRGQGGKQVSRWGEAPTRRVIRCDVTRDNRRRDYEEAVRQGLVEEGLSSGHKVILIQDRSGLGIDLATIVLQLAAHEPYSPAVPIAMLRAYRLADSN